MIKLLINKITQAIVNSKAFESKLNDWTNDYVTIDNLTNEIENSINNLELEDRVKQIETSIFE